MSEELNDILGYGKKVKVMIGKNGESEEPEIKEFHFTPVSIKDMPELEKLLQEFFNSMDGKKVGDQKSMEKAAKIIEMSMRKMHPDIKHDKIMEMFTLGAIAKVIKVVMDVNDFLVEMGEIKELSEKFQIE